MKKLPFKHMSIRVPWHDRAWNGTICADPKGNQACVMLESIRNDRDDEWEAENCSKQVGALNGNLPPCVKERGAFMSSRPITVEMAHKLAYPNTYFGHMRPVDMELPAYSANAVPFRWTNRRELEPISKFLDFGYSLDREPSKEAVRFESNWVLNPDNQSTCLETFFSAFQPDKTLCFFYAKHVPFVEAQGRVIVGVGFMSKPVPPLKEFNYEDPNNPPIRGYLWDRPICHSIRPDHRNGFLLPYHHLLAAAANNAEIDPESFAAFAPADRQTEFSYVSEHVSPDGAIGALRSCYQALQKMEQVITADYPWATVKAWINERLTELEKERGPFPGLGSALIAMGMPDGVFLADYIRASCAEDQSPWALFEQAVNAPSILTGEFKASITPTVAKKWKWYAEKKTERRDLLILISRIEVSAEQARLLFELSEDAEAEHTDEDLTANPYLFYELTRHDDEPISFATVDRGIFPGKAIEEKFPLPECAKMEGPDDARRLRALIVSVLDAAAEEGHSCLLRWQVLQAIRELELEPPLLLDKDTMEIFEGECDGEQVVVGETDSDNPVYQLEERDEICRKIRTCRHRVEKFTRFTSTQDWSAALRHPDNFGEPKTDRERIALEEKAHALKELYESPFSVLIGSAGTGKTSLIRTLCQDSSVSAGGILLLAPTGKARVRLEQGARHPASTLAQFLNRPEIGAYDGATGRYLIINQPISPAKTIIVDESSMLTEDQLASLLSAVTGYERMILVGDSRQLPPIGVGRPFVDIINLLRPERFDPPQFKVGRGYAELTVRMRQNVSKDGDDVNDLQLADLFGANATGSGNDEILAELAKSKHIDRLRIESWETQDDLKAKLFEVIADELPGMQDANDTKGFSESLGGERSDGNFVWFNLGAEKKTESWQILSPVRNVAGGSRDLNRFIQRKFQTAMLDYCRRPVRNSSNFKLPKPMGPEEIVYGDKVINLVNHRSTYHWPKEGCLSYVANGEIGVVLGARYNAKVEGRPSKLEVAFSSQPGFKYDFTSGKLKEDDSWLELAYAITVHKSQGSEFGITFVVIPERCPLISREMLYTAFTRQKDKLVILHQGKDFDIRRYTTPNHSDTARRFTNLFHRPDPIEIESRYVEACMIYRSREGLAVESKSEMAIASELEIARVPFAYNQKLEALGEVRYPDFVITHPGNGKTYYWEHCGRMDLENYRKRWDRKKAWYAQQGHTIWDESRNPSGTLIETIEDEDRHFSQELVKQIIQKLFL